MKKFIMLILLSIFFSFTSMAECEKPSTYENTKYDKQYGWQNAKQPNDTELHILQSYQEDLLKLRCQLRSKDRSCAYCTSIPKEVMSLNYTKQFKHKDGTIPVFKLIVDPITEDNLTEKESSRIDSMFNTKNITKYQNLPSQYKEYLEIPDTYIKYSFRNGEWRNGMYPIEFTIGTDSWRIFDICESNKDSMGFIYTNKVPKIRLRFFIDSTGNCNYVDMKSEQNGACDSYIADKEAKSLYKEVRFLPATRNGKPVGSYVEVIYTPWVYSPEEWIELKRKALEYK